MLRLIGFFLLALALSALLRGLPGVGPWFGGFFGFWIVAILLSVALTRLSVLFGHRRALVREVRRLGEVESPHNQGKLGSLLLAHGRPRQAVAHLAAAASGEPERAEWRYRLGAAQLASGRPAEALEPLEAAARMEPEFAYGEVQLLLSEARLRSGRPDDALAALDAFERNHGASPESSFRRGQALRRLGRKDEARTCFARATELARKAARFQRARNRPWVLRAWLARLT
jgi:tetratricopeptide (TPR) repeat protein